MHVEGGPEGKPKGCYDFPRTQADIDEINRQAEAAGYEERCILRIE